MRWFFANLHHIIIPLNIVAALLLVLCGRYMQSASRGAHGAAVATRDYRLCAVLIVHVVIGGMYLARP